MVAPALSPPTPRHWSVSWNNYAPPTPFLSVWVQFRLRQRSVSHLSAVSEAAWLMGPTAGQVW